MKQRKFTVSNQEELTALLDQIFSEPATEPVPKDEVYERFHRVCRLCYGVVRSTLDSSDRIMPSLHETAVNRLDGDGLNSAAAAVIIEAISQFLDMKQKENKELFKTEFILALDRSIESAGRHIEETYDTGTEQSTQGSASGSLKTS